MVDDIIAIDEDGQSMSVFTGGVFYVLYCGRIYIPSGTGYRHSKRHYIDDIELFTYRFGKYMWKTTYTERCKMFDDNKPLTIDQLYVVVYDGDSSTEIKNDTT